MSAYRLSDVLPKLGIAYIVGYSAVKRNLISYGKFVFNRIDFIASDGNNYAVFADFGSLGAAALINGFYGPLNLSVDCKRGVIGFYFYLV